jgi:ABC-type spermidine/putrescine transport system permease subunit I
VDWMWLTTASFLTALLSLYYSTVDWKKTVYLATATVWLALWGEYEAINANDKFYQLAAAPSIMIAAIAFFVALFVTLPVKKYAKALRELP